MQDSRAQAIGMLFAQAEARRELIGRLEPDAAHIHREAIRLRLDDLGRAIAVLFDDASPQVNADAVSLQVDTARARGALLVPTRGDFLTSGWAEPRHFSEPRRIGVEYG